jgi:hypothetical protein
MKHDHSRSPRLVIFKEFPMITRRKMWQLLSSLPLIAAVANRAAAQPAAASATSPSGGPGMEMLTIFLRHDQSKTLDEINNHLKSTGWYKHFPPEGVEVLSWYVMMGIGQVVTLKFPAEKLRDINALIEREAWGGYRTEFYPTYDFRALYKQEQSKNP